ncbi:MAG: sterol desaturase family protein [Acidobacteria bacterium]|nr:sterol desaturase family protein [Acidobacteriota bacterium]
MTQKKLPGWFSGSLIVCSFALLWLLERRRPLRRAVEPKGERTARNLAVAGLAAASLQLVERPVVERLTALVEKRRWGLLKLLRLPRWLEVGLALLLMDYTLYLWHVLNHRVPFLWRFHLPHHVDLDLDSSTALRFHFGELILASGWRAAQVTVIGVSPVALSVWQTFVLLSVLFHHSNVRLPREVEEKVLRVFVTPRMHGIHHSIVKEETNSNWSSGFTVWDWLHGTLQLDIPQEKITIGVPAYREPNEVTLEATLEMPFVRQRPTWLVPGDGQPTRTPLLAMRTE